MDYKVKNYKIAGWLTLWGIVLLILLVVMCVYIYFRNYDLL